MKELRLELLLGRRILDRAGKPIGRIEEICAEPQGDDTVVTEVLVGESALLERLAVRQTLGLVGLAWRRGGYRVRWDQLDLADPARPRLCCEVGELQPLE
jgi:sporulation protein YlmC with PRC-barrel domain